MRHPIDLRRIRVADARLRRVARDHPEALAPDRLAKLEETMAKTKPISLRLTPEILEGVEIARAAFNREHPGADMSVPDMARMLIAEALKARGMLKE